MRVAVTAVECGLDAEVDPRFGRCPYFLVVDTDDWRLDVIDNANRALGQGAGIQSARLLADRNIGYVLTGHCGPNACRALVAAGVGVIEGCAGKVRDVIEQFTAGRLQAVASRDDFGLGGKSLERAPVRETTEIPTAGASGLGQRRGRGSGTNRRRGGNKGRGRKAEGGGRGKGRKRGRDSST